MSAAACDSFGMEIWQPFGLSKISADRKCPRSVPPQSAPFLFCECHRPRAQLLIRPQDMISYFPPAPKASAIFRPHLSFLLALALLTPPPCHARAAETKPAFYPQKLAEMDAAIEKAIADHHCPGGVLWLEHRGASYHKAYGHRALVPIPEPMTEDTIFDAASLTKVVACTPAMMLLVERGQVDLNAPVQKYIPEFKGDGKESITVRQLMTHTSGLPPDIETRSDWHGQEAAIEKACAEKLEGQPGTVSPRRRTTRRGGANEQPDRPARRTRLRSGDGWAALRRDLGVHDRDHDWGGWRQSARDGHAGL